MGMSIEKAMNELKAQTRYYKDFWGADASDYVVDALNTAISTMQKYQKIQEIYKKWASADIDDLDAFREFKEVLEDGNE